MTNQTSPTANPKPRSPVIELWLETLLFAGRWLMAPVYVGLLIVLGTIVAKFVEELALTIPQVLSMQERDLVMFVLSLVDLTLLGNLVLMVAFVGYENFVSKMHSKSEHEDRPNWMGNLMNPLIFPDSKTPDFEIPRSC
jgi:uncharacterized protein (TIGR00645 family)